MLSFRITQILIFECCFIPQTCFFFFFLFFSLVNNSQLIIDLHPEAGPRSYSLQVWKEIHNYFMRKCQMKIHFDITLWYLVLETPAVRPNLYNTLLYTVKIKSNRQNDDVIVIWGGQKFTGNKIL